MRKLFALIPGLLLACTLVRPLDYLTEEAGTPGADTGTDRDPRSDVLVPSDGAAGEGKISILATGQFVPRALAQDATHLYWSNDNGERIMALPKAGGAPKTVATLTKGVVVAAIAVDADSLYAAVGQSVFRIPKAGGDPVEVDKGDPAATALVVDETKLFVVRGTPNIIGNLVRMNKDGTVKEVLSLDEDEPIAVAQVGTQLYWPGYDVDGNYSVLEMAKSAVPDAGGAQISHVPSGQDVLPDTPAGFAVDQEGIFWQAGTAILTMPLTPLQSTPVNVFPGEASGAGALQIALDNTHLFVMNPTTGVVIKVAKGGGTPEELASKMPSPTSFVVDDKAIYATVQVNATGANGLVVRIEKNR